MARSLVPVLTLAALLAACSHNSPPADTTIAPGGPNASTSDAGRDGRSGPGGRGTGRGDQAQALFRGITMSADQQQRIDTIRTRYRTQMEQMRNSGDRDAMRSQMRPLMEKQQAELRAVLTPDQQQQFDQNAAEVRTRMERGGRPGGAPPE